MVHCMICSLIIKFNLKGRKKRVRKTYINSIDRHDSTDYSKKRDETVKNQ